MANRVTTFLRTGAGGTRRGLGRAAGAARGAGRLARRAANAGGAGRSGLGALIETASLNAAGDALVAVALAGTLFFGLDVNQARGQVALYLLVTMAPFALVAPLIGPVLDRMRHARRYAVAGAFAARGLLCWGMAGAVVHGDVVTLLPAAFGVLVLSKAFGVLRAAVTPRVLPEGVTLVTANGRVAFAGLLTATAVVPVGAGVNHLLGPDWLLRITTVVFLLGVVFTMRLPGRVDVPDEQQPGQAETPRWRTLPRVGPVVAEALAASGVLRTFSGFLVLYLAFLLREDGVAGLSGTLALALLVGGAGAGGLLGTAIGVGMKDRAPRLIMFGTLAAVTAVTVAAALFYGLWTVLAVAVAAGVGQSLGKLATDAVVQREIGEEVRSSTFAVSETLHQLVWVAGGLLGLAVSVVAGGPVTMVIMAVALAVSLALLLARSAAVARRRRRDPATTRVPA
ncbi:MFS transporter [Actinomadura namibiensis]|uniref:MFS family permease n=1 Tax=Actinomadura namibiensis TaxID=182080 RepID=A0A7W3M043_ACTNM|nr:MFS transporter [Actinomadura namibiensis]MBA8957526.1 MFS family permease [Actinomadura namibiensis]